MSKMFILQGLPGSGKSTWARESCEDAIVCSADAYFETNEDYTFNPALLGEAHAQCFRTAIEAAQTGKDVIIDNTNLSAMEMAPYYALAKAYSYEVIVKRSHITVGESAARNTHGVPLATIARMKKTLDAFSLPSYWEITIE